MPRRPCTLATALALTPILLALAVTTASADGGHVCSLAPGRPACTILRPFRQPGPVPTRPAIGSSECVVLVGGLGSPTDRDDRFFAPVLGELDADPRFQQYRFGVDAGSFDTYRAISRNGEQLRSVIHHLSTECQAIHVLSHSMGGAVADRAFSMGDLANDGVVSYVALAAPHNGATGARAARPAVEADALFAAGLSATTRAVAIPDPTTDAVRDLSRLRAPRPVRDVEAVRLRLVTDEFVLRRDNADRRVDVRDYLPTTTWQLEGHGQVVHNETVQQVVRTTIATHRVPAEDRSSTALRDAELASIVIDQALAGLEDRARIGLLAAALTTRSILGPVSTALSFTSLIK